MCMCLCVCMCVPLCVFKLLFVFVWSRCVYCVVSGSVSGRNKAGTVLVRRGEKIHLVVSPVELTSVLIGEANGKKNQM